MMKMRHLWPKSKAIALVCLPIKVNQNLNFSLILIERLRSDEG